MNTERKHSSHLSPAKQALLEKRLRGESTDHDESRSIPRRPDLQAFPLSFAQERFWFLDQFDPGSPVNNRPFALRLSGPLNIRVLEQTLSEILRRHEVLRATFSNRGGRPIQTILPAEPIHVPLTDLSTRAPAGRESRAKQLATEEAQRPFDLTRGPLLRATLVRLNEEEHILILVIHHIAFDAWSAQIFAQELATLYDAFAQEKASPLAELPIQYADFAHWQRQWTQGEVLKQQLSYWKRKLAIAPPTLDLPKDYPRPPIQTFRGACQTLILPSSLVTSLKALSQDKGVTLFMTLLAAFKTLLHRYTGQEDIIVGTPIAGRTHVETEGLIGFFINTLVLRTDLSGNPRFSELLSRVREVAMGAYANQDVPFEKLVEELQPERNLRSTPFFQVMFNVENIPEKATEVGSLRIEEFEFDSGIQPFDMILEITGKDSQLSCSFSYSTDLFDGSTIHRMVGHFQTLLEGIVTDSAQRLSNLPLLTEAERHQLLVEWNDTQTDYSRDSCLHQLFEAQVERTPDAVAVEFEEQKLTYRELNVRANQVAHYLVKHGAGPEVFVGICLERCLEMITGLVAILKAGGAYVPLDPTYPKERLAFMLEDSRPPIILTTHQLLENLPRHETYTLCLDTQWEDIARESSENPASDVKPDHLAYVIYTSGSTGKPKGAMIEHRSLVNCIEATASIIDIHPGNRALQFSSISFDMSGEDIYPCLLRGATLVLRTDTMIDSIQHFLQRCQEWALTILDLPTAFWHELTTALADEELVFPSSVRLVIIGGERVLPEKVHLWHQQFGGEIRLVYGYGPTEATIIATLWDIPPSWGKDGRRKEIPIGPPIQNYQMYILDTYMQPVPIGVQGEIYIGGVGLARGYLNSPRLTAEKFISNPFSDKPGSRLYKTGDLGRFLPDGNIEFLGRTDYQLKIRGFRIEPGEIESALSQHPAVREVVVVAREYETGDKRLVAYLVPDKDSVPAVSELRRFLQEKVPAYMVPSAFVMLDAMPRMPSRKVDRQALPEPRQIRPELEETLVAPHTSVERVLAGIWSQVLGIDQVGVHDNFFELGGHSLLATRLVSRIRDLLHTELPLRSLFEAPTISQLAAVTEKMKRKSVGPAPSPIVPVSREKYRMKKFPGGKLSK